MPPTPESARIAAPAGEAVARILACADIAVGSIEREAERRVRELEAGSERTPATEALRRQGRLEVLRAELGDRAAALAESYRAIHEELDAVDRMLSAIADESGFEARPAQDPPAADPRVAAIKMTLRERQRIHYGAEPAPAAPAAQPPPWHYETPAPEPRYLEAPAYYQDPAPRHEQQPPRYEQPYEEPMPRYQEPMPAYAAPAPPRRAWLPWQRAA